ncbi:MAG: chemotaxis-specific protein-glutamate methyltransferase CheB [Gemmatimonadales bacterium]|jgi:two-component system chemotaxis response regulator CheB
MTETLPRSVLVVDDSAFMRKLIAEMVDAHPGFHVIGVARDGVDAIAQVHRLDPDIVTLDLEMPKLDGLDVLQRIMSEARRPVVVLSAGGAQYGDATLRALELGAVDFVRKPSGPVSLDLLTIRDRLVAALEAASRATLAPPPATHTRRPEAGFAVPQLVPRFANHVVVIASSTGGPRALAEIVPLLPATLNAAVVIAQHLPGEFTPALAERLARASDILVREAEDRLPLCAGTVYIARGGVNTTVTGLAGSAVLRLSQPASRLGATPNADVLFESAAQVFSGDCTGVVLTGMGRDGSAGLRQIRSAGGRAIVQDEASSAIYGMPRVALAEAGADEVVALSKMASAIIGMVPKERLEWLTA